MHDVPPWGCYTCGSQSSRVQWTEHDEDGHPIRVRRCLDCGDRWETEEVVIARGSWQLRAQRRRDRATLLRHAKRTTCKICRANIRVGSYYPHTHTPRHQAALKLRRDLSGQTALALAYQRMWRRRQRLSMRSGATTTPAHANR